MAETTQTHLIDLPDGRSLGYCEFGDPGGAPLIALHGTPGSVSMMRPGDAAARQNGLRMIAVDRPGYGRSSAWPGYRLVDWVDDIRQLSAHLGLERFAVLGISGGGPFAAALAALMPQQVTAVALASPVGLLRAASVRAKFSVLQRLWFMLLPARPRLMRVYFSAVRRAAFWAPHLTLTTFVAPFGVADRQIVAKPANRDALVATFLDGLGLGIDGVCDDLRLFALPWQVPLRDIRAPVTVWQGMADRLVPPEAAFRLAEAIPGGHLNRLPDAGHFWVFEHFGEVLADLAATIDRCSV